MRNFFAGPGKMPASVLKRIQDEMIDYAGTGMSVMEWSHRSDPILALLERVQNKLRRLLKLPDTSDVLLLQGGGSLQFHMVPMNLTKPSDPVDYIDTGYWTQKAIESCRSMGRDVQVVAKNHCAIPRDIRTRPHSKYLHLCTNNTVVGTQWFSPPTVDIPLVADMSSDFLSTPQNVNAYDLIYAHAQKTVGTAGVTIVVFNQRIRQSIVSDVVPFFDYRVHAATGSNYHTPPVFAIYVLDCMLDWLETEIGGLERMGEINRQKAEILYGVLDQSEIYIAPVKRDSRSMMNVVFDIEDENLSRCFSESAKQRGFLGLDGHRSRGGFRASLYNAVTVDDVSCLVDFMLDFEKKALAGC
ncbi:MAG: 3-phosphoserine/phosphohydroxythreonine transaminase [Burkholderiaceae bacterium]|nr:3-phosphoserine/phosphohydroxythreonine transaminase [Burkholderiaceae bacterium]